MHERLAWLIVLVLALAPAGRALAQTTTVPSETTTTSEGTTTTREVPEPALTVPAEEEPPAAPEWTYRFLVPTAMLLGVAATLGIIIGYFVKVTRSRYKVGE